MCQGSCSYDGIMFMPPNCMYGVSALDTEDHTRKQHKPGPLGRDFGYVSANCCTSHGPTQKAYCIPRRQEKPDIGIRLSNKNPSSRHEKQPFEMLIGGVQENPNKYRPLLLALLTSLRLKQLPVAKHKFGHQTLRVCAGCEPKASSLRPHFMLPEKGSNHLRFPFAFSVSCNQGVWYSTQQDFIITQF